MLWFQRSADWRQPWPLALKTNLVVIGRGPRSGGNSYAAALSLAHSPVRVQGAVMGGPYTRSRRQASNMRGLGGIRK